MQHMKCSELKKRAGIGSHISIKTHGDQNFSGKLYGVTAENIHFKDDLGMAETIPWDEISHLEIREPLPAYTIIDSAKLYDFMTRKNKIAAQAKLNLIDYYSAELSSLAKTIPALSDFFGVKKIAALPFLSVDSRRKCVEEIETIAEKNIVTPEAVSVALTFVDFAAKDFASCAGRYISRIMDDDFKDELPLAFLYNQMNDYNQCFFWLTQYFLRAGEENIRDTSLWWHYLQQAAMFASYEEIPRFLKTASQKNARLAIESLAYLFVLNGMRTQSSSLLTSIDNDEEASDICENYCRQLRSDPDNQYHRYLRCFKEIIGKRLFVKYDQPEGICGFVYDFVPSRSYGNILGYDLLRYFFYSNEGNCSNSARNTIKKNICTLKPVAEEELVMVTFCRSSEAKRTYEALNIV